jgi:hypothetical protein
MKSVPPTPFFLPNAICNEEPPTIQLVLINNRNQTSTRYAMQFQPPISQSHHKKAKTPAPPRTPKSVHPKTTTELHRKGSGPPAPRLFFAPLPLVAVAEAWNPLAADISVATGLYDTAPPVPVAVALTPCGTPVAVCVTLASFSALVALGILAPPEAKGITFEPVALKSVWASAMRLLSRS